MWTFIRHGTRTPSRKIIGAIKRLVQIRDEILRDGGTMCAKDMERLRQWSTSEYKEGEGSNLVAEGFDELVDLGERMQHRFPYLLPDHYDNATYKVRNLKLF